MSRTGGVCYEEKPRMTAMDKKERETLGAYLRREREAREIKLTAVSKATKIGLPLLVALEADNQAAFPDKKAVPDYLKSYCRYLLIDEEEALKRFESQPVRHCLPEAMETCLPEVIEDPLPPPVVAPSYTLPPSVLSSVKEAGFFRKYRLFFMSVASFVFFFVFLSGIIFYFHPLRDRAVKTEVIKAEVPRAAIKSPAPAVKKEKVVGNRDSKRYHLPGMKYYHKVEAHHRVEFDSETAAIRAGYHKAPR